MWLGGGCNYLVLNCIVDVFVCAMMNFLDPINADLAPGPPYLQHLADSEPHALPPNSFVYPQLPVGEFSGLGFGEDLS